MNNIEIKFISKHIKGRELLTVVDNKIYYEKNNLKIASHEDDKPSVSKKIEIEDEKFIEQMLLKTYSPVKNAMIEAFNNVNNMEVKEITRPKNTAQMRLSIKDSDFEIDIDMYVAEYGDIFKEFLLNIKQEIFSNLEN